MTRKIIKYLSFIFITLISVFSLQAQRLTLPSTEQSADILQRFDWKFRMMDSIIFRASSTPYFSEILDTAKLEFNNIERVDEVDNAVKAKVNLMKSQTGLEFTGQAYVRPGSGVSYDPDDPLVAYNAKLQAELRWDIFNSSIYKRGSKKKELLIEGELNQLNYVKDDLAEQLLYLKQYLNNQHYSRLLSVMTMHSENIDLLLETQVYLLENGKISGDDLLKLVNEKSELDRQLISLQIDSIRPADYIPQAVAYICSIDTAGIMKSIRENNIEIKKLGLRHDLLSAKIRNTDYAQTMNIEPFVRYSYYNRKYVNNTYNIDLGVSFRLPISKEVSKKRRVMEAEQDVLDYEQRILESETTNGIFLAFQELKMYNENIRGEYQRMKNLRDFLSMRTHSYSNVDGEYSRITRLQEYNAFLQAWERLLEYTYRRDCVLLNLQGYLLYSPVADYIEFEVLN
ncbi:MAG: hypothetical protein J1E82_05325 [Muribaculaceae bacterium]|nr:hypothetical protein [Muribaculaceae bacterium]